MIALSYPIEVVDLVETLSVELTSADDLAQVAIAAIARATGEEPEVIVQHYPGQDVALVRVIVRGRPVIRAIRIADGCAVCGQLAADVALELARVDQRRGFAS